MLLLQTNVSIWVESWFRHWPSLRVFHTKVYNVFLIWIIFRLNTWGCERHNSFGTVINVAYEPDFIYCTLHSLKWLHCNHFAIYLQRYILFQRLHQNKWNKISFSNSENRLNTLSVCTTYQPYKLTTIYRNACNILPFFSYFSFDGIISCFTIWHEQVRYA